jgi:bifunctional non-homologous end joining protein LigD
VWKLLARRLPASIRPRPIKNASRARFYSRPGNDLTYRFPLIVQTLARLRLRSCIIDGGAVACDDNGVALFNRVRYRHDDESIFLYAFDLIELNGDDLRPDPLERRKATRARPGQSSGSGKIVQLALRMFRQSQRARS